VPDERGPYEAAKWSTLADHPLVGEARIVGMMGALELSPDKANRARFAGEKGAVGLMCRDRCFANELIMRCVGDTMIISPPLVLTREEADMLVERAARSLDETLAQLKSNGMMIAA
jgi:putrescine aminotransferase